MGCGQDQDYEATLPVCITCNNMLDVSEVMDGYCTGCQERQKLDEQRETEEMNRTHPHD